MLNIVKIAYTCQSKKSRDTELTVLSQSQFLIRHCRSDEGIGENLSLPVCVCVCVWLIFM